MNNYSGLTLIELMMVLALSGLMMGFAVPSYMHWLARVNLRVAVNQLIHEIEMTKQSALNHGERMMLASDVDGCWQSARIVRWRDQQLVATLPPLPTRVTAKWQGNLGQTGAICFLGNGLPEGDWGSFRLQAKGYVGSVRLVMNGVGRLHVEW